MESAISKPPSPSLARARGWLLGALGFSLLAVSLLAVNGLQALSLVVLPFAPRLFRRINRSYANGWWGACVFFAERLAGVRVRLTGDELPPGETVLLIANHQQMPDIVALMSLAIRKSRLGDLKWFVKDVLKYVPGIGWGMLFLDCVFLKRDWDRDQGRVQRTFANLLNHGQPFWLVSFSEGTRITPAKLERSRAFARRQPGLWEPSHVMIPRTKGFCASVSALRPRIDAVYDVTIGYEGGIPTLWQYLQGSCRTVHVHVRRFAVPSLPGADAELASWLLARFREKDQRMAGFRAIGRFD